MASRDEALGEVREGLEEARRGMAAQQERIALLDEVARRLAERVVRRERQLKLMRGELAAAREREEEGARSLVALGKEIEEIRSQARGQATRIRMQALRQASRLGGNGGANGSGAEPVAGQGERNGAGDRAGAGGTGNGPASGVVGVFEGLVQVEIGPLADFSQLVRFEDAAGGISGATEVSVRRFSRGRATLAMRLKEPVELLRELEERTPFEFKVRSLKDDRLILDLAGE